MKTGIRRCIAAAMFIALAIGFLGTAGCQQKMADQPSYKPLEASDFFADGRSERPAVAGTVARGHLHTDVALFTGRREGMKGTPLGARRRQSSSRKRTRRKL